MSKRIAQETARRAYIRLLSTYAVSSPTRTDADIALLGELIDAKLLPGGVTNDSTGKIAAAKATGITVEGRLFLQRLREEERQESLFHKSLKYIPILIGYLAGLLSPLFTNWIKTLIK